MKRSIVAALLLYATGALGAPPDPNRPIAPPPTASPAQVDPARTIVLTAPLSTIRRVEQSVQRSPYLSGREATQAVDLIEDELARQAQPPAPAAAAAPRSAAASATPK